MNSFEKTNLGSLLETSEKLSSDDLQTMEKISKEDFLQALELKIETFKSPKESDINSSSEITPINGQIFFGTSFSHLGTSPSNCDQIIKGQNSPNIPVSPKLQTACSSNGDLYSDAKLVFDNSSFDCSADPDSKLIYRNKKRQQNGPRSPSKLASEVPVVPPIKRRGSFLFPNHLKKADTATVQQQNNQNALKEQELENSTKVEDAMTALSTRFLEPYDGVNLDDKPCIENYITKNFNNDTINFNNEFGKQSRSDGFEPPLFKYDDDKEEKPGISAIKYGWFEGVFIRTSVNLLGVMLFMRMGFMSGQCGILIALLQIIIATLVTSFTTLSMNALCTNGDIGAGGIYSMISRSLGPEAGANIGIIFAFTNAAFVGLNLIGAADAIIQIFNHFNISIFDDPLDDTRLIGLVFLIIIALIPLISLQLESKTQTFFFILILICILDYLIGSIMTIVIPPTEEQMLRGFHGFHTYVAKGNLYPKFVNGETFFSVFSVFFPSVTPVFTGACMSGDLKNPETAIPKGTFLSIAFTSFTYCVFIVITGCTIVSFADGRNFSAVNDIQYCSPNECKYGLVNDYNTVSLSSSMAHIGWFDIEPFIYTGILAATLSSALGCYMACPRIFQSFAEDKILPFIGWFAKGYGSSNDPRRGYLLTLAIAAIFILIGDLNKIAVYISNFYLNTFFIVNVACFHAAWVKVPSFRPSFKYFNKWVSLITGIICFILMFLLDYVSATFSVVLMLIIYFFIKKLDVQVNWGTTSEAQLFNLAHSSALKWDLTSDHVKNYRPRIVCLTGNPSARTALLDMGFAITKDYGLLFALHLKKERISVEERSKAEISQKMWLYKRKIRGFYTLAEAQSLNEGIKQIVPVMGLGKLKPNIVMMGYKSNWQDCTERDLYDYYTSMITVLDQRNTLIVFRIQEGFDFSNFLKLNEEQQNNNDEFRVNFMKSFSKDQTDLTGLSMIDEDQVENTLKSYKDILKNAVNVFSTPKDVDISLYRNAQSSTSLNSKTYRNNISTFLERNVTNEIPKVILRSQNQFQQVQKPGTIDVWWLFDTGGICILIAFILRSNHLWRNSKIRVFSVIQNTIDIPTMKKNLIELLHKFRIPFSDVIILTDSMPANDITKLQFRDVINEWIIEDENNEKIHNNKDEIKMRITKSELINHRELTNRYIRLRELLLSYSYDATLIVMSMPRPSVDTSAPLFLSFLEMLSQGLPPFLLIRGSQSVLTFYC